MTKTFFLSLTLIALFSFGLKTAYLATLSLDITKLDLPTKDIEEINSTIDYQDETFLTTSKYETILPYSINDTTYSTDYIVKWCGTPTPCDIGYKINIETPTERKEILKMTKEIQNEIITPIDIILSSSTNEKL